MCSSAGAEHATGARLAGVDIHSGYIHACAGTVVWQVTARGVDSARQRPSNTRLRTAAQWVQRLSSFFSKEINSVCNAEKEY